jgi:hypothetical protein
MSFLDNETGVIPGFADGEDTELLGDVETLPVITIEQTAEIMRGVKEQLMGPFGTALENACQWAAMLMCATVHGHKPPDPDVYISACWITDSGLRGMITREQPTPGHAWEESDLLPDQQTLSHAAVEDFIGAIDGKHFSIVVVR